MNGKTHHFLCEILQFSMRLCWEPLLNDELLKCNYLGLFPVGDNGGHHYQFGGHEYTDEKKDSLSWKQVLDSCKPSPVVEFQENHLYAVNSNVSIIMNFKMLSLVCPVSPLLSYFVRTSSDFLFRCF